MIAIVDYGMGNLHSVLRRVEKLGYRAVLTSSPDEVAQAEKIILPGVGAFGSGIQRLRDSGMFEVLNDRALKNKTPIMGICLGMQMMARWGEEGDQVGFGWINADCVRFRFEDNQGGYLRTPHMGWNTIEKQKDDPLLQEVPEGSRFYFIHSYYIKANDPTEVVATTDYGVKFASIIRRGNIFGTQFHPEKSHQAGAKIIEAFLSHS